MDFINNFYFYIQSILKGISLTQALHSILTLTITLVLYQIYSRIIIKSLINFTAKSKTKIYNIIYVSIKHPGRLIILSTGLWLSLEKLNLHQDFKIFIDKIMISILWYTLFWILYNIADFIEDVLIDITHLIRKKIDLMIINFMKKSTRLLIVIFGSITIIQSWGPNITGIITGLGIGGLAFALAAKDTIANLFGSVTLMIDRPFETGDSILTPHVEGTVEELGFRSTRVRTSEQSLVTIPNSTMSSDTITNCTKMGKRRVKFNLKLAYITQSSQLKEFINRVRIMLENHSSVHPQSISVYFESFGESSFEILICFFTKETSWQEHLESKEKINFEIMAIIDQMGISLALPSTNIYIKQTSV